MKHNRQTEFEIDGSRYRVTEDFCGKTPNTWTHCWDSVSESWQWFSCSNKSFEDVLKHYGQWPYGDN